MEIGFPFCRVEHAGVSIRFFLPPAGTVQPLWVCLDDLFRAIGLHAYDAQLTLQDCRATFGPMLRTIQSAGEKLTAANWLNANELLDIVEVGGFTDGATVDDLSAKMMGATLDFVALAFEGGQQTPAVEAACEQYWQDIWKPCATMRSLLNPTCPAALHRRATRASVAVGAFTASHPFPVAPVPMALTYSNAQVGT